MLTSGITSGSRSIATLTATPTVVPGVILVLQHGAVDLLCSGMLAGATLLHR
jgi:hypothetical protein